GPLDHPQFAMLAVDIRELVSRNPDFGLRDSASRNPQSAFRGFIDRLRAYFLTQEGKPRGDRFAGTPFNASDCDSPDAWKRHRAAAAQIAPLVAREIRSFRRDLNAVMSRGVWRIFAVT